jgi:hypothetical protein
MNTETHNASTVNLELTHTTSFPNDSKRINYSLTQSRKHTTKQKRSKKKQKYNRRLWSDEEDEAISSLVETYGTRRWTFIAKKLQEAYKIYGRTGKQCRER